MPKDSRVGHVILLVRLAGEEGSKGRLGPVLAFTGTAAWSGHGVGARALSLGSRTSRRVCSWWIGGRLGGRTAIGMQAFVLLTPLLEADGRDEALVELVPAGAGGGPRGHGGHSRRWCGGRWRRRGGDIRRCGSAASRRSVPVPPAMRCSSAHRDPSVCTCEFPSRAILRHHAEMTSSMRTFEARSINRDVVMLMPLVLVLALACSGGDGCPGHTAQRHGR